MAKFNYKFESIKNVKETLKKKAQKELSEVQLQIEMVKKEIENILAEKKHLKQQFWNNPKVIASEIQSRLYYENFLDGLVKSLNEKLNDLESLKNEKLNLLSQKSKEHKIFETLESKHYEAFLLKENKDEQIQIDEIASKRFVRGKN